MENKQKAISIMIIFAMIIGSFAFVGINNKVDAKTVSYTPKLTKAKVSNKNLSVSWKVPSKYKNWNPNCEFINQVRTKKAYRTRNGKYITSGNWSKWYNPGYPFSPSYFVLNSNIKVKNGGFVENIKEYYWSKVMRDDNNNRKLYQCKPVYLKIWFAKGSTKTKAKIVKIKQ